jgi:FAD synthetase
MKKVIVFGAFDVIHEGHIHMLKEAKEYGDFLIAVVGRDVNVEKAKGKQPLNDEKTRLANVEKLGLVDRAILGYVENNGRFQIVADEKPDIVALGYNQIVPLDKLEQALDEDVQIVRLQPYRADIYNDNFKPL